MDQDGFLYITDRKKELLKTSGGKLVAPQPIENKLKNSILWRRPRWWATGTSSFRCSFHPISQRWSSGPATMVSMQRTVLNWWPTAG